MDRVDVHELECFVAIADHLSFTKAARQLRLSQPPLTRQIQALEKKLGTKVFTRSAHAVALTNAGARFLEDARAILRHVDHATGAIRYDSQGETGRLRLAFIMALANVKLVQLIQRFRKANPASLVEVSNMYPSAQLTAMQAGFLDGGFIVTQPMKPLKGVAFADWGQEPLLLVLPEEHSLTRIGKLRWQHLQGLPWVMISHQDALHYRDLLFKIMESHGLAVQIAQEANTIPTVLFMVAAGMGVAMVPQSAKHLFAPGVVFRQLPDPRPILHHVFAYRTGQDSPVLDKFLSLLRTSAQ
jgi:DNA-binding transcriptional LysR family regulator